jgi:RimJ/RimL family protein N-acetyltransferase
MAFGPIMQFTAKNNLQVELAPIAKEDMGAFVSPGMQQASVSRYLSRWAAPVLEDEHEWYEKVRTQDNSAVWGIWVIENGTRKLIGSSGLESIERLPIHQATSGSLIFDTSYWGKGIASSAHKARTWYGFQHMGLVRIKSAVIHGNVGSRTALERSGYIHHSVERNVEFIDGQLHHMDNLECLNPADWAWRQWWGNDRPTKRALAARTDTRATMDWAENNVTLP